MSVFLIIIISLLLFVILGFGADLVVINLKELSNKLGLKLFFLGMILGIVTSLPELAVGINAAIRGIPTVSVGNLLGGIIVLLGLILGTNLLLHKEVKTDGEFKSFLPISLIIILPIFLGLDGKFGPIDGALMIISYLIILWLVYRRNKFLEFPNIEIVVKKTVAKEFFYIIIGLAMIILSSSLIIKIAEYLLNIFEISPLLVGLLVFAIGTNLPEITVAFKAWRRKSSELSVSNLIGSAAANIFVLGIVSTTTTIAITLDKEFFLLAGTLIVLTILFSIFYKTDKKFTSFEGAILLLVYFLFLFLQYFLFL